MKSNTKATRVTDTEAPDAEEPCRSQRTEKNTVVPGSPMSAMVATINNNTLGLSPSMTMAGAYLGMGLASQLGFFSSANQYQCQSMVAMASVAGAIKRHPLRAKTKPRQSVVMASTGPAPSEAPPETHGIEDAMVSAEKEMRDSEST